MERTKHKNKKTVIGKLMVMTVALIGLFWLGSTLLSNYRQSDIKSALKQPIEITSDKAKQNATIASVSKFLDTPDGQTAIVGEIVDLNRLTKYQEYFKKARNGDMLLIYPNQTIIYDPVNNYIVDIAMVNLMQ